MLKTKFKKYVINYFYYVCKTLILSKFHKMIIIIYLLALIPTIIAFSGSKKHKLAILFINIFVLFAVFATSKSVHDSRVVDLVMMITGVLFIVWLVLLIWSIASKKNLTQEDVNEEIEAKIIMEERIRAKVIKEMESKKD